MVVNARVEWDEENSPKAFIWCWAVSQLILLILLTAMPHHSLVAYRHSKSTAAVSFRFLICIPLMITASIYLQLIFNGFWHKNPYCSDWNNNDSTESAGASLHLNENDPKEVEPAPPALFEQSMKSPDPVVLRDEIQWKRMLFATLGMGTLVACLCMFQ
jgi:hypothetical protein